MSCGYSTSEAFNTRIPIKCKSLYLGPTIPLPCPLFGQRVSLSTVHKGITIKVIDAQISRLPINSPPTIKQLKRARAAIINRNIPDGAVDIMFCTINYLDYINEQFNIRNVIKSNVLYSAYNFKDLDNAFFTGNYMIFGEGHTEFKPLVCADVISHELTHGLTQTIANLEYKGESGALNESFSDIVACGFEHYIYRKYNEDTDRTNDIQGEFDFFIGEDIAKYKPYLRNMKTQR